jgi:hypothetical protein
MKVITSHSKNLVPHDYVFVLLLFLNFLDRFGSFKKI